MLWQNRIHELELEQKAALAEDIRRNVRGSFMATVSQNLVLQLIRNAQDAAKHSPLLKLSTCAERFACWEKHCYILQCSGFAWSSVLRTQAHHRHVSYGNEPSVTKVKTDLRQGRILYIKYKCSCLLARLEVYTSSLRCRIVTETIWIPDNRRWL